MAWASFTTALLLQWLLMTSQETSETTVPGFIPQASSSSSSSSSLIVDTTVRQQSRYLPSDNDDNDNTMTHFSCPVDEGIIRNMCPQIIHPRKLILVFASKRTGSNLFGGLLKEALGVVGHHVIQPFDLFFSKQEDEVLLEMLGDVVQVLAQQCSFRLSVSEATTMRQSDKSEGQNVEQPCSSSLKRQTHDADENEGMMGKSFLTINQQQRDEWVRHFWNSTPDPFPCSLMEETLEKSFLFDTDKTCVKVLLLTLQLR